VRLLSGKAVGWLRHLLMVRGVHKWNALVRDATAKLG
jgi:hypothetical protein